MTSWKGLFVSVLVGSLAACADPATPTDTGGSNDAANDVNMVDTAVADTATTPDVTDTGSATDANAGVCGATAVSCVCGCGANATCQNGCLSASTTCSQCVLNAQGQCCPTQAAAFAACAMAAQMASDAGPACTTQACIQMRCMTEIAAFQSCVNTASASDAACQGHLATCFGTYPIQCP